jgi:hypothetical protein
MKINQFGQFMFLAFCSVFSVSSIAGVIELSFPWGKESACAVTAKYWDGAKESYTCSKRFSSQKQPGSWGKGVCSGANAVENLEHRDSRLDISIKGRCYKTYMTNLLGEFKVTQNQTTNITRQGSWFVSEGKTDNRKFNNAFAAVGGSKMGWGAVDLRSFKHNNRLMIFLNKEARICVRQKSGACRAREEAHYTQIESE